MKLFTITAHTGCTTAVYFSGNYYEYEERAKFRKSSSCTRAKKSVNKSGKNKLDIAHF